MAYYDYEPTVRKFVQRWEVWDTIQQLGCVPSTRKMAAILAEMSLDIKADNVRHQYLMLERDGFVTRSTAKHGPTWLIVKEKLGVTWA